MNARRSIRGHGFNPAVTRSPGFPFPIEPASRSATAGTLAARIEGDGEHPFSAGLKPVLLKRPKSGEPSGLSAICAREADHEILFGC